MMHDKLSETEAKALALFRRLSEDDKDAMLEKLTALCTQKAE